MKVKVFPPDKSNKRIISFFTQDPDLADVKISFMIIDMDTSIVIYERSIKLGLYSDGIWGDKAEIEIKSHINWDLIFRTI